MPSRFSRRLLSATVFDALGGAGALPCDWLDGAPGAQPASSNAAPTSTRTRRATTPTCLLATSDAISPRILLALRRLATGEGRESTPEFPVGVFAPVVAGLLDLLCRALPHRDPVHFVPLLAGHLPVNRLDVVPKLLRILRSRDHAHGRMRQ